MQVDRCICHQISFAEVKEVVDSNGIESIEELRNSHVCSTKCKMCEPYILKMMETGKISFKPDVKYYKD